MKKLLLLFVMMATWMVVGCNQVQEVVMDIGLKDPDIIEELELFLKMPVYLIINV